MTLCYYCGESGDDDCRKLIDVKFDERIVKVAPAAVKLPSSRLDQVCVEGGMEVTNAIQWRDTTKMNPWYSWAMFRPPQPPSQPTRKPPK